MKQEQEERTIFASPKQIAKMFGLSVNMVYKLTYNNEMKFYKIGRSVRFKISEVEEFFNSKAIIANKEY